MSKPRVFVSSTYYDLKYVRERLERFISSYGFEPILFESDSVYFNPKIPIDKSCYNEVTNCHLMILVVGGRYGSLVSDKDSYEKQYISITRREYETAKTKGIPVMIFIEQNVYTEYRTYQTNKKSLPDDFRFAYVDDIKIFEFITILEQNAIKSFNKVDDIEHYFTHQISGMLLSYLTQLQAEQTSSIIKTAVEQLNVVSKSMQTMINSIAEKVLEGERGKYKELLQQQNQQLIDFFIELLDQNSTWQYPTNENIEELTDKIYQTLMNTIFNPVNFKKIQESEDLFSKFKLLKEYESEISKEISALNGALEVNIRLTRIFNQLIQIQQLIKDDHLGAYFTDELKKMIRLNLSIPF